MLVTILIRIRGELHPEERGCTSNSPNNSLSKASGTSW